MSLYEASDGKPLRRPKWLTPHVDIFTGSHLDVSRTKRTLELFGSTTSVHDIKGDFRRLFSFDQQLELLLIDERCGIGPPVDVIRLLVCQYHVPIVPMIVVHRILQHTFRSPVGTRLPKFELFHESKSFLRLLYDSALVDELLPDPPTFPDPPASSRQSAGGDMDTQTDTEDTATTEQTVETPVDLSWLSDGNNRWLCDIVELPTETGKEPVVMSLVEENFFSSLNNLNATQEHVYDAQALLSISPLLAAGRSCPFKPTRDLMKAVIHRILLTCPRASTADRAKLFVLTSMERWPPTDVYSRRYWLVSLLNYNRSSSVTPSRGGKVEKFDTEKEDLCLVKLFRKQFKEILRGMERCGDAYIPSTVTQMTLEQQAAHHQYSKFELLVHLLTIDLAFFTQRLPDSDMMQSDDEQSASPFDGQPLISLLLCDNWRSGIECKKFDKLKPVFRIVAERTFLHRHAGRLVACVLEAQRQSDGGGSDSTATFPPLSLATVEFVRHTLLLMLDPGGIQRRLLDGVLGLPSPWLKVLMAFMLRDEVIRWNCLSSSDVEKVTNFCKEQSASCANLEEDVAKLITISAM